MRIVFWGTPTFAVNSLLSLNNKGHEIIAVITQPDRKRGRGKKLSFSPIKETALDLNLTVYTSNNIKNDHQLKDKLIKLKPDLFIVVAFGQILPKEILEIPIFGSWNSHASLLPRWRGAAPIQWSILMGDKQTGVGIMLMEEGLDTGPIILEQKINISKDDNIEVLSQKLSLISANLLVKMIDMIDCTDAISLVDLLSMIQLKSQNNSHVEVKYARQISKSDNIINWDESSLVIKRKILGLYPNAYTKCNNKRIKILSIKDEYQGKYNNDGNTDVPPGTVLSFNKKDGLIVKTMDGAICIEDCQLEGKNRNKSLELFDQIIIPIGSILY